MNLRNVIPSARDEASCTFSVVENYRIRPNLELKMANPRDRNNYSSNNLNYELKEYVFTPGMFYYLVSDVKSFNELSMPMDDSDEMVSFFIKIKKIIMEKVKTLIDYEICLTDGSIKIISGRKTNEKKEIQVGDANDVLMIRKYMYNWLVYGLPYIMEFIIDNVYPTDRVRIKLRDYVSLSLIDDANDTWADVNYTEDRNLLESSSCLAILQCDSDINYLNVVTMASFQSSNLICKEYLEYIWNDCKGNFGGFRLHHRKGKISCRDFETKDKKIYLNRGVFDETNRLVKSKDSAKNRGVIVPMRCLPSSGQTLKNESKNEQNKSKESKGLKDVESDGEEV